MLQLSSIYRFPLKSGKGESLSQVRLDTLGVEGDRRWMLVDEASGRFLTQRTHPHMSQLSALWNANGGLTLKADGFEALEVPVPQGRVGMIVLGGLNPLAAVEEVGIPTGNRAMGTLLPFEDLRPYQEVLR